MAEAARKAAERPILKVKLGGGDGDGERIAAVRSAAPDALLVVDANEGWREHDLEAQLAACFASGVALVEQPLPAADDALLGRFRQPYPDLRR